MATSEMRGAGAPRFFCVGVQTHGSPLKMPMWPTRLEWGTVSAAEADCLKGVYGTAQAVPFHKTFPQNLSAKPYGAGVPPFLPSCFVCKNEEVRSLRTAWMATPEKREKWRTPAHDASGLPPTPSAPLRSLQMVCARQDPDQDPNIEASVESGLEKRETWGTRRCYEELTAGRA